MFSDNLRKMLSAAKVVDKTGEEILQTNSEIRGLIYPRRYKVPAGYTSSRKIARRMACILSFTPRIINDPRVDATTLRSLTVVQKLGEFQVPTYWVGQDLLVALCRTELPNIHGSELNWPMPAMLFMLPKNVLLNPNQASVDYLGVALGPEQTLICWTQVDEESGACNYAITEVVHKKNLSEIKSGLIQDDIEFVAPHANDLEAEISFNANLMALAINLMLVMSAYPHLIELGQAINPRGFGSSASAQADAPWTPNWIGKQYRLRREDTSRKPESNQLNSEDRGTKRPHWRIGHHRVQRYGHGLEQFRWIWIEPTYVNARVNDQTIR